MSVKDVLRAAFGAKDQRAFDAVLDTIGDETGGGMVIHNHIPATASSASPGKGPGDDEPPPWFKKHAEETDARFKAMHDALNGALQQWAAEEEQEPNHNQEGEVAMDRRRVRDRSMRSVHDRLDALHDAVSHVVDWARDQEESRVESGDRRGRDRNRDRRSRDDEYDEYGIEKVSEPEDRDGYERNDTELGAADRGRSRDEETEEEKKKREEEARDRRGRDRNRDRGQDRRDRRSRDDTEDEEILGELEFEAPLGIGGDRARRATDSGFLRDSFQDLLARAEIIAPGFTLPAFDRAVKPVKTIEVMTGIRRTALDLAWNSPATRGLIESALGGQGRVLDSKALRPQQVRTLFNAVSAAAADANNTRATTRPYAAAVGGGAPVRGGQIRTIADINKMNSERYHGARRA